MNKPYRVPVTTEDRLRTELALSLVATSTGVPIVKIRSQERLSGPEGRARRLAIYLAYVTFGWNMERVGHAFGLNRTTAAKACRWVEDARDSKPLDELLDRLEDCAKQVLAITRGLPA